MQITTTEEVDVDVSIDVDDYIEQIKEEYNLVKANQNTDEEALIDDIIELLKENVDNNKLIQAIEFKRKGLNITLRNLI